MAWRLGNIKEHQRVRLDDYLAAGSVTRTFDDNFRVTALAVDGSSIAYGYDNDGLLTSAGDETVTRDPSDGLITGSTLGGITTAMTYDSFGEQLTKTVTDGATNLYSVGYTRDNLGRITQKTETVHEITTTWNYGYDGDGRLDAVTENGYPVASYGYDANGNRVSINAAMVATYDNQDRLLTYAPSPGTGEGGGEGQESFTYNANGELLEQRHSRGGGNPDDITDYTWDALGNLTGVKLPDGTDITYLYDGQNRRIGKEVNGTLKQGFLYDGQLEPVAELDGSGNVVEQFVYGTRPNVPDYIIKRGIEYRVISDQVGSPVLIVSASTGAVAEQISYDAWGNVISDTNPGFQPFGFAGGLYDSDTGLVHFGARDYDPQTGRWISKDTILFAGGNPNLYSYVLDDPVNKLDPMGLQPPASWGGQLPIPMPPGMTAQDVQTQTQVQQAYNQSPAWQAAQPNGPEVCGLGCQQANQVIETWMEVPAYAALTYSGMEVVESPSVATVSEFTGHAGIEWFIATHEDSLNSVPYYLMQMILSSVRSCPAP